MIAHSSAERVSREDGKVDDGSDRRDGWNSRRLLAALADSRQPDIHARRRAGLQCNLVGCGALVAAAAGVLRVVRGPGRGDRADAASKTPTWRCQDHRRDAVAVRRLRPGNRRVDVHVTD